jgi:2-methylcitrate dehydratase
MSEVEELARFVGQARYDILSLEARREVKIRVLDALGCAIGALAGPPIERLRAYLQEQGGNAMATLIGGGRQAMDRVAFYNSALVRYLDFNDSFLAKKETCHPSDNLGAVLAASEYASGSGKDFLTALAVAYQIQCRLSEVAPVRAKGFDHTTQGAYAVAAGVAKALGLDERQTASAVAISGTTNNALRVTRTGKLSNWKGLAYPYTAFSATNAVLLAKHGITGPSEVFEGNKGFKEAIAGPFTIDWPQEDLEIVLRTSVKKYNAEFHSQSALEGLLELREKEGIRPGEVERIEVEIFDVAYHIIGGGEEGKKDQIHTKEEADHSLPYMLAVALLDGEVTPRQYLPERIRRADVQELLRKISIRPAVDLSERFPQELPCRIQVMFKHRRNASIEKHDFTGFYSHPLTWEQAQQKFTRLAEPFSTIELRERIIDAVEHLEGGEIRQITSLLAQVAGG